MLDLLVIDDYSVVDFYFIVIVMVYPDFKSSFYEKQVSDAEKTVDIIDGISTPEKRKEYADKYGTELYSNAFYRTALVRNKQSEHENNVQRTLELIQQSGDPDVLYWAASRKNETILLEILKKNLNEDIVTELLNNEDITPKVIKELLEKHGSTYKKIIL